MRQYGKTLALYSRAENCAAVGRVTSQIKSAGQRTRNSVDHIQAKIVDNSRSRGRKREIETRSHVNHCGSVRLYTDSSGRPPPCPKIRTGYCDTHGLQLALVMA